MNNKNQTNAYTSYNSIVKEFTERYISSIQAAGNIPAPENMADGLLQEIQNRIELENAVIKERSRKYKNPKCLENISIAELILAFYPVKRISWTESDRESNNLLCIYQTEGEDRGLYIPHKNAFANLIRQFNYCISDKNIGEVISILSERAPLCSVTDNPDLIAVNNGIFDYRSKQLMDFTPDYVFTAKSKVNYNSQASNVTIHNPDDGTDWDVETWFDSLSDNPEIIKLLWQVAGAVVRPHVPWNKVVCLYSEIGNNGKGTLCELLRQLCGNSVAISFEQFAKDFLLEQLIGSNAVIGDENNTSAYLKSSEGLKCVITGDCLTINGKFKKPVTFRFQGLMVQCVNNLPKFSDKSESLTRRLLMVPFEKCFTGRERKYIKADYLKRPEVLEYVMYKVLYDTSYYSFDEPQACNDLLNEYKQFNDPVRQFLEDILPELVWDLVPSRFLYELYKSWFKRNNPSGQVQGKNTFLKDVRHLMLNDSDWQILDSSHPTGNRMNKPEPLIVEYELNAWKNPSYHGNDIDKICTPCAKASYRGLLRVGTSVNSVTQNIT